MNLNLNNNLKKKNHQQTSKTVPFLENSSSKENSFLSKLDLIDKKYSNKIHTLELNEFFELIIYISARVFNPEFVVCYFICFLCYLLYFKKSLLLFFKFVLHVLIILIITLVIKYLTARQRPELIKNVKRNYQLRKRETNCSMPSGDAMQSANFAMILILYFNCYYGIILVPFVMVSRVFYSCHYIGDTVVGASMGIIVTYLSFILFNSFI